MLTPSLHAVGRRAALLSASILLLSALVSPVFATEAEPVVQTVETQGTEQRALIGTPVLNDIIARDSSQITLSRDAVTGVDTSVDGNVISLNNASIFASHATIAGNVNASDSSIIVLTQTVVDGNVEVNGNAVVAIGPQTVVSGDIEGVFLGTDADGYAIYTGQ